eukprot:scaffold549_cov385-Prasinococcus_capsulatus_cf.AAC.48
MCALIGTAVGDTSGQLCFSCFNLCEACARCRTRASSSERVLASEVPKARIRPGPSSCAPPRD